MSLISFKDNTGTEIFNNVLSESLHENHERLANQNISFLNNCEKCIVCHNGMEKMKRRKFYNHYSNITYHTFLKL